MTIEGFDQALRKLSSIFGWRSALQVIEDALRRDPGTYVPRALQALTARTLKPRAAERIKELLAKLARQDPRVRAALAKASLQQGSGAIQAQETLEKAGQPIQQLKQYLTQANTIAQQLKTLEAEDQANQLAKTIQETTKAILSGADIAAETTRLKKTITIHETKTQIIKQLNPLLKNPWAKEPAQQLLQQTRHTTSKQTLNTLLKKTEALNKAAQELNKAIQQGIATPQEATELLNKITKAQTPNQAEQQAEIIQQTAQYIQTIKKLGLTLKRITQYLNHIQNNYPKPIQELVRQTLANPPEVTESLKQLRQEILQDKPPYKTWALQKYQTPKNIITNTLNRPPKHKLIKLVKQWEKHLKHVNSVALSPDGTKIVVGSGVLHEGRIIVLSSSGEEIWKYNDFEYMVNSVAWSPDGTRIVAGTGLLCFGKVMLFSSQGHKLWEKELGSVESVSFSPSGSWIVAGVTKKGKGRDRYAVYVIALSLTGIELWRRRLLVLKNGLIGAVNKIAFSYDGTKIVVRVGWEDRVNEKKVYRKAIFVLSSSGRLEKYLVSSVEDFAISPNSSEIVIVPEEPSDKILSYDLLTGRKIWESEKLGDSIISVAWSPDGTKIAVGVFLGISKGCKIVLLDSTSRNKIGESNDLHHSLELISFSKDGKKIVVGTHWSEKVASFGFSLSGLCDDVTETLRFEQNISPQEPPLNDPLCLALRNWILGECQTVKEIKGTVHDMIDYLCSYDYFGVAASLLCANEFNIEEKELYDLWKVLTMGWGNELTKLNKSINGLARYLGIMGLGDDVLLDWLAGELLKGGAALEVAGRVRGVLERLQNMLPKVLEVKDNEKFVNFVRVAYRGGGLREFVEVLESGLRFLGSPGEVLRGLVRVRGELSGDFRAGFFGRGVLRVCCDSLLDAVVEVSGLEGPGVRASVVGGSRASLRGGGCVEFPVSAAFEFAGDTPLRARLRVSVPGLGGFDEVLDLVARVAPGVEIVSGRSGLAGKPLGSPAPSAPIGYSVLPSASFALGKALVLGFKPPRVEGLRRRFRVGGFEVRGLIGFGGFAVTLLGVDEVGRSFVVKVPREVWECIVSGITYSPSEKGLAAFKREFSLLSSLRHPHIVEIVAGGVDSGMPYVVMEFCEKGSLRGVLESQGRLGIADALLICIQIADVLRYIHSNNIVHRDLKPENILFTREGILKVTDFNIAKVMRTVSPTTSARPPYTPGYAAPEQILRGYGRTGPWSDVWSLGVILYEAVVGEPPFDPWDYEEAIREPPNLDPVPKLLRDIIASMLSEEPKDRPGAKEVEEELARILYEISSS
ncbi:MAG: protein kinase [Desulfurococcales archaeon]|nr:protein kinase [Desulfurococcales archaeon]